MLAVLSAGMQSGAPGAPTVQGPVVPALDGVLAEQFARSPLVPGIVARVDAPGVRWERAIGKADRAAGTPPSAGNTFRIASVTKTFTAAAVSAVAATSVRGVQHTVGEKPPEAVPDSQSRLRGFIGVGYRSGGIRTQIIDHGIAFRVA